ncbi:MAG: HD domain-containing protein [Christensenellales bacterium]|jgi:uncharacterized protein
MSKRNAALIGWMIDYHGADVNLTEHMLKVHGYAKTIGYLEGLDSAAQAALEAAAIVHDIGIPVSRQKYGSHAGHYQEMEGPKIALEAMEAVGGFSQAEKERVCNLVGRHHTYTDVDGLDCRILLEADYLVNSQTGKASKKAVLTFMEKVFKTKTGIEILKTMHGIVD